MDSYTKPNLYATGLDLATPNLAAVLSEHPSSPKPVPANPKYTANGYVGDPSTTPGQLNRVRWSYGFQPGTVFAGNSSSVTVSGERPADGAAANATLNMRVYRVPSLSFCKHADKYTKIPATPDTAPAVMDAGNGHLNVDWGDQDGVISYNVYRKIGLAGTYGLPVANTTVSSYTDPGPLESKLLYHYMFTAVNTVGESPASPESFGTITYDSMILGDSPVSYHRLGEAGPSPAYRAAVLAAGPTGYWRLGEPAGYFSAIANEVAGGAPGGNYYGTLGQAGPLAPATSAYFYPLWYTSVNIYHAASLSTPGAMTLEAWIKPLADPSYRAIATKSVGNGATNNPFELRLNPAGQLQFLQSNGTAYFTATTAAAPTNGVWHHVAATKTATGAVVLYIDGIAAATAAFPATVPLNTEAMFIARRNDVSCFFLGNISDVALYTSGLSAAQILAHYNLAYNLAPAADSALGAWFSGVYTGAPTLGVPGINISPANTAMSLDGSGSRYVTLPAGVSAKMGNKTTVSAEGWVNLTALPPAGTYPAIISEQHPTGNDVVMTLNFQPTGQATFSIYSGGAWHQALDPTPVTLNAWQHYAGTYDGATLRLYRNGNLVATSAWAGSTPPGGGGAWYIGKRWDYNESPTGKIDEVALYDTVLSPARVKSHYDAGK